jgi:hypothetical protein
MPKSTHTLLPEEEDSDENRYDFRVIGILLYQLPLRRLALLKHMSWQTVPKVI